MFLKDQRTAQLLWGMFFWDAVYLRLSPDPTHRLLGLMALWHTMLSPLLVLATAGTDWKWFGYAAVLLIPVRALLEPVTGLLGRVRDAMDAYNIRLIEGCTRDPAAKNVVHRVLTGRDPTQEQTHLQDGTPSAVHTHRHQVVRFLDPAVAATLAASPISGLLLGAHIGYAVGWWVCILTPVLWATALALYALMPVLRIPMWVAGAAIGVVWLQDASNRMSAPTMSIIRDRIRNKNVRIALRATEPLAGQKGARATFMAALDTALSNHDA